MGTIKEAIIDTVLDSNAKMETIKKTNSYPIEISNDSSTNLRSILSTITVAYRYTISVTHSSDINANV
jgi:hypothetical protein